MRQRFEECRFDFASMTLLERSCIVVAKCQTFKIDFGSR